jgi:uncharacterized metal-binding protein
MPTLPKNKVGLISCSGEELPEGTLSRMATLRVLEKMRPNDTVTLCLPLFLAGDDKERAFAKFYPTIAIDGCDKRCAAHATGKYSAVPAASLIVPQILAAHGLECASRSRRQFDTDEGAMNAVAQAIALRVDEILEGTFNPDATQNATEGTGATATCSCGSGVPVMGLHIAGKSVEVVALPLLFEQFHRERRSPEQLMDAVKVYNAVPRDIEAAYREAVFSAYAEFCSNQKAEA